jgi:hypothetical protein
MNIAYIEPFGRAWARMKTALFKPFNLTKWFIVGFTAFLAGLMDGYNGGSGSYRSHGHEGLKFHEFLDFPKKAWEWMQSHPAWIITVAFIALFVIALLLLLLLLSSRGKFMFLDNVVHNKAEIANPWKEYREEGHSLFLWRLGFGVVCFVIFIAFSVLFFTTATQIYSEGFDMRTHLPLLIAAALIILLIILAISYISLFLSSFVVPIMYKYRLSATDAWGRFLPIMKQNLLHFFLYGLFVFIVTIAVVIGFVFAGIFTCCVGIVLLALPYIGTVVTLPAWYTFRAFSLEFFAQFGEEFSVFPPPVPSE